MRIKLTAILLASAVALAGVSSTFSKTDKDLNPSDASTTFQLSTPKKAGQLKFMIRILDKKKKKVGTLTEVLVLVPLGMTRAEKLEALKDSLDATYPAGNGDINVESTSSSVVMTPTPENEDVGKIKILKVVDTSEEAFDAAEHTDWNASGPLGLSPIPLGFFPPSSPPLSTWEDWIIFDPVGTPSGVSSSGGAAYVAIRANSLEIIVPTAGLSKNQLLDALLSEVGGFPEFVGAVDYTTGRIILLSENEINQKGIGSRDSGIDMSLEVMPAAD